MKNKVSELNYNGIAIGNLILKDGIDACNFENIKYNLSVY